MYMKIKELNKVIKNRKGKLFLFGAGNKGKEVLVYLNKYNVQVEAFIDNNEKLQTSMGKRVISLNDFFKNAQNDDFILITCACFSEIEQQLEDIGWNNYMYYGEVPDIKEYVIDYDEIQNGIARTCWEKAVEWLLEHKVPDSGISYSNKELRAYPEVTGYIIPTLVDYGYIEEARDCAKWLLSLQKEDGGFTDLECTKEFIFDTAQILRGFLIFREDEEIGIQIRGAIEKACEFLYNNMVEDGKGGYALQYEHDNMIPESILLYTVPPFIEASKWIGKKKYIEAAEKCVHYYEMQERFLDINDLTHFLAYQIEALIDLGKQERVQDIMDELFASQMGNGAIPSHKNSKWICTPGAAQLALCELKLGKYEHAEKILEWFAEVQREDGGFWGSYGADAKYFHGVEIAWAVKYYLDAERLYIEKWFDENTDDFPETIEVTDDRYKVVKEIVCSLPGDSIIAEVGCGKGRFIKAIIEEGYQGQIEGIDLSEELLSYLPNGIKAIHGKMENIPCEDEKYDFVYCIEALEHSQNMDKAVKEMTRILKPKGKLLIIDKDKAYWGIMKCSRWENWICREALENCMKKQLCNVKSEPISKQMLYMIAWQGEK